MRTLAIVLVVVLVAVTSAIAGAVIWYKLSFPDYVHRYRLTIAIEIDGQMHTGSSVIEIVYIGQPYLPGVGSFIPRHRGQATVIDLGSRGTVVAALHRGRVENGSVAAAHIAIRAYGLEGAGYDSYRLIREQSGRRNLTPDNMPLLIWFANAADPATARVFKAEHIAGLFGPTARLAAAHVEITSDPVVIDIDKKFPWYRDLADRQKAQGVLSRPNEFQPVYNMFIGEGSSQ
jgi:hypothetical protein